MQQDNSTKAPENISNEDIWKKLMFIQEEVSDIKGRLNDLEKRQRRIEDSVTPKGGTQPSQKGFSVFSENGDLNELTEIGEDVYKKLRKEGSLTRKGLDDILIDHDMSRSKPTVLDYLKTVAGEVSSYLENSDEDGEAKFISGTQGGRNGGRPSRVVLNLD